jgi:phosphatidylserine synthase
MRIKPYVVLGLAAIISAAAVATIVTTSDPYAAEPRMVWLFWAASLLAVWSMAAALFSLAGQRLASALVSGAFWAAGILSLATLAHQGIASTRLSLGIIGATILLSVILWWRSRRNQTNG